MPRSSKLHVLSLLQLILSGSGILFFLTTAAGLALLSLVTVAGRSVALSQVGGIASLAWTSAAISVLLMPSAVYAALRLLGIDRSFPQVKNPLRAASILMFVWPSLILVGHQISRLDTVSWIILPPLQTFLIAIPIWWLVEMGRFSLTGTGARQTWGVLSVGLLVSPPLILIIEILLILIFGIFMFAWLASQPALLNQLTLSLQRVANSQMDPEVLLRVIRPYVSQPGVVYGLMGFSSGLVPMVEELLKPLAVWFLIARKPTPSQGFTAGLLCGAAFAFLESMGATASPMGDTWSVVMVARAGTGLLHIVTSALVGWGLAVAWSHGQYLRLAAAFLVSISLHAIWNVFGILSGVNGVASFPAESVLGRLIQITPIGLAVLVVCLFMILLGANHRLRANFADPALSEQQGNN